MEKDKIYLGDAYELIKLIPDKSIDLIVTDPPYLLDINHGGEENDLAKTIKRNNNKIMNLSIDKGIDYSILDEWMRVMKKPNIYIWCNKKQILDYMKYFVEKHGCSFEIMCWCKTDPVPLCGGNYMIDKEFCLYFRKGVKLNTTAKTAYTYWVQGINREDKKHYNHPTIKPLEIIKTLIKNSSNEDDVVLDTFLGSGTTAVACKETNRRYIGFELNEEYYNIACKRIKGITASGQVTIFNEDLYN